MYMNDIIRHLQMDIVNLNTEVHVLKKKNEELNKTLKGLHDILLKNIEKGVLFCLIDCDQCNGSGHMWECDSCRHCDDPIDCSKCKGKGDFWGKACG